MMKKGKSTEGSTGALQGVPLGEPLAIAEALKMNSSLTQLYLQMNQIGNEGAAAIAEALKVRGKPVGGPSIWSSVQLPVRPSDHRPFDRRV